MPPAGERKKCIICDRKVFIALGARECSSCVEKTLRIYKPGAPLSGVEAVMFAQVIDNLDMSDVPLGDDEFPVGDAGLVAVGIDPEEYKGQVKKVPFDGEARVPAATDAWVGLQYDLRKAVAEGKKSLTALLVSTLLAGALIGSLLLLIALQIGGRIK